MVTITPNEGLEFIADRTIGVSAVSDWEMFQVAVGSGTESLNENDTQLESEEYRANKTFSNLSIEETSTDGEISITISVSGGTEVDPGTGITEFGIFAADPNNAPSDNSDDANDILLHKEHRNAVTIESGDRKTFQLTYSVDSQ